MPWPLRAGTAGAGHSYPDEEGQSVLDCAYPGVDTPDNRITHTSVHV